MAKYCLDMSGLSNPAQHMPQDIHASMWKQVEALIVARTFATTTEVYEELTHIPPPIGECIASNAAALMFEVGTDDWDWQGYIKHTSRMQTAYDAFISERNRNREHTINLNDLSVIALAKTLVLPLISMEARKGAQAEKRRAIPDICDAERVQHMTFSDLLRAEGIVL
ncbi:MAG: DUF4411 family protein [Sphingomicrobium sp.]|nr:DUF4411 family protein [Sphingomonadales bacterium]